MVYRASEDLLEIFDSLGGDVHFFRKYIKIPVVIEFNITILQCLDSRLCGSFVLYFIILRYLNLDLELKEFLNEYFYLDCKTNENLVNRFLAKI